MEKFFKRAVSVIFSALILVSFAGCDEETLNAILDEIDSSEVTVVSTDTEEPEDSEESEESTEDSDGEKAGPYEIVKIVDGDTLKLDIDGEKKNVRLIGVDTPESVHPDKTKNVPEGKEASDHTKELLSDITEVYLVYGTEPADRYGRPLCYVYLPDGTMLNRKIIEDGYGKVLIIGKNKEYKEEFNALQEEAKAEGRGLWPTGVFDDTN